jgi:hypothetical protein
LQEGEKEQVQSIKSGSLRTSQDAGSRLLARISNPASKTACLWRHVLESIHLTCHSCCSPAALCSKSL